MDDKDIINEYFVQIISVLDNKDLQLREILHKASDIEDFEKSQQMWSNTRKKIEKIKDFKNAVNDIKDKIILSEIFDEKIKSPITSDTEKADIYQANLFGNEFDGNLNVDAAQNDSEIVQEENITDKSTEIEEDAIYEIIETEDVDIFELIETKEDNVDIQPELQRQESNEYLEIVDVGTDNTDELWLTLMDDLTGKKVNKLYFDEKKYWVNSFTDAYVKLCELLYDIDKDKFLKMMLEPFVNTNKIRHISRTSHFSKDERNYYTKMNNANIYVWVNKNNHAKAQFMIKMLKFYGLPETSVKLLIDNDESQVHIDDVSLYSTAEKQPEPKNNFLKHSEPDSSKYENITDKPHNLIIDDKSYKVRSWEDVLIKVMEHLIARDPYDMMLYIVDSDKFIYNKNDAYQSMKHSYKLSNGYWMDTAVDKNAALDMLYEAIEKCEYPKDYIEIE